MKKELSDKSFREALFAEDDLGSVIRVHLHIEYHVNEIMKLLTPFPEDLKPLRLDYDGKVTLICALGIDPKLTPMLSVLGKMRNKFAHNPFYQLDKSEVKNLYKSLSEFDKQVLQESHDKTRKNETWNGDIKPYSELDPKGQFILIAVLIRNALLAGINEINQRNV